MPTVGRIDDVEYRLQGWCIRHLAYKYKIIREGFNSIIVYVDTMPELKAAIADYLLSYEYD